MKIYNLIENLDDTYGGPAKSVPYLCYSLNKINVDTEILSIKYNDNESNSVVNNYNLKWKSFKYNFIKKARYSFTLKSYLHENLKNKSNTIIHIHNSWNYIAFLSYKISFKYDVPFIISIRGSLYDWSLDQSRIQKKIAWVLFQKKVLQNASCIHVTELNEMAAVRDLGIKTPIAIIPNGISLDEFKKINNKYFSKKSLHLNVEKKYILFMSRLHPKKGLEYLVNAWVSLANKFDEWDLIIVGPDYDKKYVKNLVKIIEHHNLQDRVVFTGMVTGKKRIDLFGASDLFVLPSHTENFGIVIAEAMAAKLPVITTHGTPWKEIKEKNAGWWVELSQENIDNTLKEALSLNGDKLEQKGLNGFRLIQKYEWKYQADKMNKLYNYILNGDDKPEFIFHS